MSTERIDHAGKARDILGYVEARPMPSAEAAAFAAAAQAHATLALAEQQRIANLIAASRHVEGDGVPVKFHDSNGNPLSYDQRPLTDDVREGLGL